VTDTTPHPVLFRWAPLAAACLLAACGGGDDGDGTPPPTGGAYTVGGTLAGLAAGKTLVLQNNGENDLSLTANGSFQFTTLLDSGVAYAVTVKSQPAGQRCTVAQGTGRATDHVRNVQVGCENLPAATYTVGGTVSGLAGGTLVLQNGGRDDLQVTGNGGFTFATPLVGGAPYAVTVKAQPAGQACTVRNGSGAVNAAHVGSVEVACATASAALPEGDWQQDLCVPAGQGKWGRGLWRIAKQGDARAAVTLGIVAYGNAACTGTGAVEAGPAGVGGSFAFDRTGATATATAFWGKWTLPTGLVNATVWVRKGAHLCVLGDTTPSVLNTPALAESTANLSIAGKSCYTKL